MDTRKNNVAISLKVATGSMDVGQLTRCDLIIPLTEKFQFYDKRYSGLLFYEILMISFSPKELVSIFSEHPSHISVAQRKRW